MPRILVTGADGQLGHEIRSLAGRFPSFTFYFTDKDSLDITDATAVKEYFAHHAITHCINCAAYTAVDKAESEPEIADKVNHLATEILAQACARKQATLLHISTDYVYHNQQNRPLRETDDTQPQSVYAKTKLLGEQAALKVHPSTIVIRTSWVYSAHGHNFVKTMLRLGESRDSLSIVFDQIGAPTYAHDLAKALLHIISSEQSGRHNAQDTGGVYNFAPAGVTSWYDFARCIFTFSDISCDVAPIRSEDYPTAAARPHFSVLDTQKFRQVFHYEIPHWEVGLMQCLTRLEGQTLM